MNDKEFEKARDDSNKSFAGHNTDDDSLYSSGYEDGYKLGADWAYEYCKNHRPYAEVCNSFAKSITEENLKLREKLKIATEDIKSAMEYYKSCGDEAQPEHQIYKMFNKTLEKIGEK